jgi:CRISPR-associated protein Cas2
LNTCPRIPPIGAPDAVVGALSRRFIEVRSGLFVGDASARSIDALWSMVENAKIKCATLIYPAKNSFGLSIRQCGSCRRRIMDFDGLVLMGIDTKNKTF